MKSRLPIALLALAALGSTTLASFAGAPTNTSTQVFKGTIKSKYHLLDADSNEKGSYSVFAYYIQSRSEGTERLLVVNPETKVFFIEHSGFATFTLANNNNDLFNLRTNDLRDLWTGTGSLVGRVKPGTFAGISIDFHTPSLAYEFHTFGSSGPTPYLATHDKAKLKIDKAMMNLIYAGGPTNVSEALTDVINFLASKGYVGLP
jgi:hypothetical protein